MKAALAALVGLVVGGVLTYFLLVGAPRMEKAPGVPVRAPDAGAPPAGTAVLALDENFFNTLLGTIFAEVGTPSFKLSADASRVGPATTTLGGFRYVEAQDGGGGCANQVVIVGERAGTRTGVRLQAGEITAPLVFNGSYAVPLLGSCVNFSGTADAQIAPFFRREDQTLFGQINVRSVQLDNVAAAYGPAITSIVQTALNRAVNPITIMRGSPLTISMPISAAGGTLRGEARDVRSEVQDGTLRLFVTYDFKGTQGQPPPQPAS
jgi:hypothetical protein